MSIRVERVQNELHKQISIIVREDLRDPRIGFITIIRVELTPDIRHARVYFSVLGEEVDVYKAVEGMQSASGFIRKLLGGRMSLRYVPTLEFKYDDSIEYNIRISQILEGLNKRSEDGDEGCDRGAE